LNQFIHHTAWRTLVFFGSTWMITAWIYEGIL
jgi:hypothetical protein